MNPTKDASIEYAHIYTNNKIGDEHKLSVEILSNLYKEKSDDKKSISLVVMVDDYSFPDPTFDYKEFSLWLADNGFKPDLIIRESQLIPVCDEVLKLVKDTTMQEQLVDYIQNKKYPCSLFIAAWYLLRLGYIRSEVFEERHIAKELINILPESFKPFEDKALEIISSTDYFDVVKKINYKFFNGRLVA